MNELQLPLFKRGVRDLDLDLCKLLEFLECGWRTARKIQIALGFNERYIRNLAENSNGQVIGSDRGYKLTLDATPEEIREWRGRYASQIERMTRRILTTERCWHSRGVSL